MNKKKFLILGIIVFAAIGFLAYQAFAGSATYYYTVSEVLDKGNTIYDKNIRVNGKLIPGSVEEPDNNSMKFSISDGSKNLPVQVSKAAVPDTFSTADELVVEGYLDSSLLFHAKIILTKCPSKYEPAK